ncbi:MAG TPA: metalloregulator ArsR/SmtB family transcription factor [Jatrophihabitantaceae bacterium]|jgi:DNA-binding transcriptional ArsR family regulator|nr:metalloregulator ArsR/SmtB family transcription factor [Jatrophihabitantaceae bacterium]
MSVESVLAALADPTRRRVLEALAAHPAASASALARELPISRQMVLRHLGVLQETGLVSSTRAGREVLFQVRSAPLADTADWMSALARQWDSRLLALKARAEQAGG